MKETPPVPTTTDRPGLAFGLNGISDWSPAQPFLNLFKTAREWIGHSAGTWGALSFEQMERGGLLDADGYLTRMPQGIVAVESFVLTEMPADADYTAGRYRLTYDGAGRIDILGGTNVTRSDGKIRFDYTPTGSGLVAVRITATDPAGTGDHLRNIALVKEDHAAAHDAGAIFNPRWLEVIEDAHALRFMDWMQTNNSDLAHWEDRPTASSFTYSRGAPVEVMVALANQTGSDPWFNIPHDADDAYIRAFATYVRDTLDPDLRAHFEFSNEVWNFMFEQARDSAADARVRFGRDLGDGWMQEYGARASEMAAILDAVYAGQGDRLVKTIATHTGWPGLEASMLEAPAYVAQGHAAPHTRFDAYAVTGYFGGPLGSAKLDAVRGWIAESAAAATAAARAQGLSGAARDAYLAEHRFDVATDLAIRELRDGSVTGDPSGSLAELFETFAYHARVAERYGLDLVMYEGGTHVVALGDAVNDATLTDFFVHLNYSAGMGTLYEELLEGWVAAGGTLFNSFVEVAGPSKWGSWGSLRHLDDETARHDAVRAFLDAHPRDTEDGAPDTPPVVVDPTPPAAETPEPAAPAPAPEPEPQPEPEQSPELTGNHVVGREGYDHIDLAFVGRNGTPRSAAGDRIEALGGDDFIRDGAGPDTISGGADSDFFSFWSDGGAIDVITDFEPGEDLLDLSAQGIHAEAQVVFSRTGGDDLLVAFGGDRLILQDMWDVAAAAPRIGFGDIRLAPEPEDAGGEIGSGPVFYVLSEGTSGDDSLAGSPTNDWMSGGAGNDRFVGSAGADHFDGGAGYDLVQYKGAADLVIHMQDAAGGTGIARGDTFAGIERVLGGAGNDALHLAPGVRGDGRAGADVIVDAGGAEQMRGDAGADLFVFLGRDGATDRIIDFEQGVDRIDLSGWHTSWAALRVTGDARGHAFVSVDGDTLRIDRAWDPAAGAARLDADDFVF
ncbi:M10 family metallopeptidase C-terminal domain-containing protein [Roseivivax isoporae]|nr:calcium-binding protein [Roseivivax isoporae]